MRDLRLVLLLDALHGAQLLFTEWEGTQRLLHAALLEREDALEEHHMAQHLRHVATDAQDGLLADPLRAVADQDVDSAFFPIA
ncbi:MAG TPA: hypothetical protein VGI39_20145, partial [Polyangiaceae bacterium]